jgi:hypothetical protein
MYKWLGILSIALLLLTSCAERRRERAILAEDAACIGGRINTVKRITDTNPRGRLRNTVVTTDACLY